MKVQTMRNIDRYVGIPLTFLFSIFLSIISIFQRKSKKINLHRSLFIELSEMGSAILADPAMRKLKQEGGGELYFVIFKDNRKSVDILGTVKPQNIFEMRASNLFVLAIDVLKFMVWCRKHKISAVIDLELFSRFTALLAVLSGARHRIGFASLHDEGLYRGWIVNCPVRYNAHVHIAVNFISLVNTALGLHDTAYPTTPIIFEDIHLAKAPAQTEAQDQVKAKIQSLYPAYQGEKIFLLNVNASDLLPQRKWLPERFAAIASSFLEKNPDWIVLGTGAPNEFEYVENVIKQVNHPLCFNSAGLFKFEELVALYQLSDFMLTNDSGPAHFASVTDLKVLVLFGPETPHLYLPLGGNAEAIYLGLPCSPCVSAANHRKTSCTARPCITGISAEMVSHKIMQMLLVNV